MKSLTEKQEQILEFIEDFQDEHGMSPTIMEIANYFEIKSSSAFAHVRALERKKQLSRSSKARSINNLTKKHSVLKSFGNALVIPLLGRVNAGLPVEANEFVEANITIDSAIVAQSEVDKLFALKIQGESMRDLGMYEDDIIIVKKGNDVKNGDIVVALVNNEVTVKSFFRKDNKIELHPANNDFKIQVYPAEMVDLQGKVVMLQRKF